MGFAENLDEEFKQDLEHGGSLRTLHSTRADTWPALSEGAARTAADAPFDHAQGVPNDVEGRVASACALGLRWRTLGCP